VRTVGAVTTSRADFGVYRPVLRAIAAEPSMRLTLYVSGMHLSARFGNTVGEIEAEGFTVAERVEVLSDLDTPEAVAESMARGVSGFGQVFGRSRPDLLLVLGDRFEMHAAALAALPFRIPVAHIHGGELTEGAFDESLRHSMTKLSHLHFVATEEYGRRVVQLGEEPWRVTVSGAPSLDNLRDLNPLSPEELERERGVRVTPETLLVTFHPTTLEYDEAGAQADELLAALEASGRPLLFTMPNADTGGLAIRSRIEAFVARNPRAAAAETLGTRGYFGAMAACAAMVGNSSSALVEAPSFGLPAVNVGSRQGGRVRGANVIDTGCGRDEIAAGITRALNPAFRASLRGKPNPYGDGLASPRIVSRLTEVPLDQRLIMKRFHDLPPGGLE
jgi:UDP-hydrolysing UDP-N-acetyl-D-glucosamine 2-epimerase